MANSHCYYGSVAHGEALANRLFGAVGRYRATTPAGIREYSPSREPRFLSFARSTLHISPFLIRKWGQVYISPEAVDIDLERLPAALYRIVAVHNFRMEYCNPRLDECLAGIFLARRNGDVWEQAEDPPIECRTIEVLGHVDSVAIRITPQ